MNINILSDSYIYLGFNSNIFIGIYNLILILLPIVVLSYISLLRNFSRLFVYLGILFLNIGVFCFIYFFIQNIFIYIPYVLMSFTVLIFVNDYERLKTKRIREKSLITDEGETRLETQAESLTNEQKRRKEIEEENDRLKSREIVGLFSDKDIFVNRMYVNEDMYKDLLLYDEIKSSDNIMEEIYFLMKEDGYINKRKFNNILIKNNVIIDINSYVMEEEIRILEIMSLREIKEIEREKEVKQILMEREESLQNDEKIVENVEDSSSIAYNKEIEKECGKFHENKSIRDIKKESKDKLKENISE